MGIVSGLGISIPWADVGREHNMAVLQAPFAGHYDAGEVRYITQNIRSQGLDGVQDGMQCLLGGIRLVMDRTHVMFDGRVYGEMDILGNNTVRAPLYNYMCFYKGELFYPTAEDVIEVVRYGVLNDRRDIHRAWGGNGAGNGQFDGITGVYCFGDEVYTLEGAPNQRVQAFDLNGNYQRQWATTGAGTILHTAEFRVVTATGAGGNVEVWSILGTLLGTIAIAGVQGLAYHNGEIYVITLHNVSVYTDGTFTLARTWGSFGGNPGEFNNPSAIDIERDTVEVYVQDLNRIQVFLTDGTFLREFATSLTGPGICVSSHAS